VETLGSRIKNLRLEHGHTLRGFARDVGVAPAFVVDIEAGRRLPGRETLTRMAAALKVPLSDLQALDPRLPCEYAEAFRLGLSGDWDVLLGHVAGMEDWQLEQIGSAAKTLIAAAYHELGRRNS